MDNLFKSFLFPYTRFMNALVPMMAVNIEVMIPIESVMEKPLMAPVPKEYKTRATIKVVKLASQMVKKALSYPASIASKGDLPLASSSRILEKIKTFASTAIPTVRTIPAIPGNVKVAESTDITATTKIILKLNARLAATPNTR